MKNLFYKSLLILLSILFFTNINTFATDIEDTSIIEELNKDEVKELDFNFNLKSFESCDSLENVMWEYIKTYWKNNKDKWRYPIMYRWIDGVQLELMEDSMTVEKSANSVSSDDSNLLWWWEWDYSKTNIQVEWVDESDIVKTDWKYIYYYNQSDNYVYIVEADELKIKKKILLPKSFYNPVLYIWWNKLTIISSWYGNDDYSKMWYWINRNAKTYVIVFDLSNIEKPTLTKLYVADGNLLKSRKIWKYVYVVSNNNFNIPYYDFKYEEDIVVNSNKILPKKIDISKTNDETKQNLKLQWKSLPYNVSTWNIAKCNEIEYVLPDEDTISEYDFSPSYNIISIINTEDTSEEVKTKVIAWSNDEIYMSIDNLYLTSRIYQSYNFSCSTWSYCIMPYYSRWTNTLVHKMNLNWSNLNYQDSTIVPWMPLNQYSMDEYKNDFRIITLTNNWNRNWNDSHTDLYILDKELKLKSSLNNLWNSEEFKSSRYMWEKLFLVTFKQIDPFFVIDLSDHSNPEVLWELKIPWYSTYLHPYDENHILWLGYDTVENQWWWTVNNGIKLDLYQINYDKKCWDNDLTQDEKDKCEEWIYKWIIVKQKYTKTLWENGSYSEALNNPRMFMWKANDKKLFLPATLYDNYDDDIYRHKDFYQWLITFTIDKDFWIKEDFRITHIDLTWVEEERAEECSKYTPENTEKKCVKLIWWWEYCEDVKYSYVPKYCYADSKISEYVAYKAWNYSKSYVKRALWIGNITYSISDDKIKSSNIDTGEKIDSLEIWE